MIVALVLAYLIGATVLANVIAKRIEALTHARARLAAMKKAQNALQPPSVQP